MWEFWFLLPQSNLEIRWRTVYSLLHRTTPPSYAHRSGRVGQTVANCKSNTGSRWLERGYKKVGGKIRGEQGRGSKREKG